MPAPTGTHRQTGDKPRDLSGRRPSIASYPPSVSFKNLGSRLQVNRNKKLGEGGFADVFMGVLDGKQCAVKVLKREMDEEQMQEVKLMKELTAGGHPHIVELLAAGTFPPGLQRSRLITRAYVLALPNLCSFPVLLSTQVSRYTDTSGHRVSPWSIACTTAFGRS